MKLVIYCTCGDGMSVETNAHNIQKLLAIWKSVHSGPGHAECDAETARIARELVERKTDEILNGYSQPIWKYEIPS